MPTTQAPTLSSELERPAFGWLDQLAEPLQAATHAVFRSGAAGMRVKSWLNGTPLRHRQHPALVLAPLGGWLTGAVLDALDSRAPKRGYRPGADAAIGFGVLGALPAVAAGLADWVDTYDHPRRVGMAHALLNSLALSCYGASLALRLASKDRRGAAKAISSAGLGAVLLSGALGGELVYTLGVNVPWLLYPRPPDEWRDVLGSGELTEGTPVVVEVERVPVLLVRHGGEALAVQEWCPHAGGPLSEGTFEGDVVECPWHQSRFCLRDGRPLQGPASVPLRTFAVREAAGRIQIRPSYEGQTWPPAPKAPRNAPERVTT
jgi:nitrite reductase/ring-hydroxylating ferredoxin subunit/uncharacterized membrane protein